MEGRIIYDSVYSSHWGAYSTYIFHPTHQNNPIIHKLKSGSHEDIRIASKDVRVGKLMVASKIWPSNAHFSVHSHHALLVALRVYRQTSNWNHSSIPSQKTGWAKGKCCYSWWLLQYCSNSTQSATHRLINTHIAWDLKSFSTWVLLPAHRFPYVSFPLYLQHLQIWLLYTLAHSALNSDNGRRYD